MYTHILLPTDGSEVSLRAVDAGIELAHALGAKVHALHVMAPFVALTYFTEMVQLPETTYTEQAIANARDVLDEVRRRADASGVSCDGEFRFDAQPAAAIIDCAGKHACDLVVMGSHGRSGFDRLLLGSQTYKVIQLGRIPVLVCK